MFLYIKGTRGYQYFGPTIASNLIEFIEKIRMPVIRLTNVNDFLDFIVQYEVKGIHLKLKMICLFFSSMF
jgi:hypothetical protein